jgi:hypothetical protein
MYIENAHADNSQSLFRRGVEGPEPRSLPNLPASFQIAGGIDNYSWRCVFYINVPVGILTILLVSQLLQDFPDLSRVKINLAKFDYIGFALLALGVSALQITLKTVANLLTNPA